MLLWELAFLVMILMLIIKMQKVLFKAIKYRRRNLLQRQKRIWKLWQLCFPIGFGVKYAVTDKVNISFEIAHRFTTTDYIDDVSTTYVGS